MLYIIPPFTEAKPDVLNVITRAGAIFVDVAKLYQIWPVISGGGTVICAIPPTELAVLVRYMNTLLPDLPVAITAVPGAFYSSEWNILAAALPNESWITLEGKLAKSGLLASTTDQVVERTAHSIPEPALARASAVPSRNAPRIPVATEIEDDDDGLDAPGY